MDMAETLEKTYPKVVEGQIQGHDYVTLKIYANCSRIHRELPIYKHLGKIQSNHSGPQCLRMLLDSFEVTGPHGQHICLVHQPLGMSLYELKIRARGKVFSKDVLRPAVRQLLAAICNRITFSWELVISPCSLSMKRMNLPRKVVADRTIYLSRPLPFTFGPPVLCDLGEARLGYEEYQDDIMPDVYRAPEVILGMKWGYKVDIWNVAMVGEYDNAYHLAQMVAVLGPPPLDFLKHSTNSLKYWDENGTWRGLAPIPDISLEKLEQRLTGDDKERFLHFVRQMLCWVPEERPTAGEAIFDPWLMEGLFDSNDG
ncbi:serine/threonine protein kinase [Polytolypa hystricis UAMH7299]|uniref:Serine/threonine protein kinase n=1 Tax=Polytolypa hystricis (strain UAMH7299) TaxID=1447883 RepID=A0A2B7Z2Y1_POLH7|nr:serine/threonine protein kinase [Polytolypa hystricis UAMH7299]